MQALIVQSDTLDWIEPPQHHNSYSKLLINPENCATGYLDFRVSITHPQGVIEPHVHDVAENVFYVIRGVGVMEIDSVRHRLEPGIAVFIPPGAVHALYNTGFEDLVTIVVGCPASDMVRQSTD